MYLSFLLFFRSSMSSVDMWNMRSPRSGEVLRDLNTSLGTWPPRLLMARSLRTKMALVAIVVMSSVRSAWTHFWWSRTLDRMG